MRAVGERLPAHPGVFGAPGATPSARGGAVPTAAPASNQKIVYTRPSSARLSKTNGLDLLQAGDAVFLHRDPPFLTHRQQKQVQAASLPRMNALLAGADGALDINDAATRARIKAARVAHYQSELDWAEDAHLRFLTTHGRSQAVPDAGLRAELTAEENGLVVAIAIARGALARARSLSLDVQANPLAYGDYDLHVDWRALPLLRDWHFDGVLVGSNAERDGFDFDTDLLNVALGGPTPVRNAFGDKYQDALRKTQRFDPRPETGDDALLLLVYTPSLRRCRCSRRR